jgi:hypothetical protein
MSEHGGKRQGAGRKPKADEQELIEKLSPLENSAFKALTNAINEEKPWAVKMFMEYRYGKPKEVKDLNIVDMQRVFNIIDE